MNRHMNSGTASVGDALMNARRLLQSHPAAAEEQARSIILAEPGIAEAYFILAASLRLAGDTEGAEVAEREGLDVTSLDPVLNQVEKLVGSGLMEEAEALLRRYLQDTPNDPRGLGLFARIAMKTGRLREAERLLWRAHGLAPSSPDARLDFERLLELQAAAFADTGDRPPSPPAGEEEFRRAIRMNEEALKKFPERPAVWLSYGHALRLAGKQAECIAAYRKAIALKPSYGEAWWSLADLKTSQISLADAGAMASELQSQSLALSDRVGIHFALGTALNDQSDHAAAFRQFDAGNRLKRGTIHYDVGSTIDHVRECRDIFRADHFDGQAGHAAADPIFIIGMPRSGSTLVEQMLSCHPSIEGTEELGYFGTLSSFIAEGRNAGLEPSNFAQRVRDLSREQIEVIGGAYLWKSAHNRQSSRPRFIDKMPRNWLYLPLIRLALPNAKIINVRRDPMDCCWSNYRQLFADGGEYSYDLADLGHFYRAHEAMVDHFDAMHPGAIYRLDYERLVADPDSEIRQLLDYLGLPFEPECLEFHRNPRAVKTASSEQVRRPISRSSIGQWKPYEEWLTPLKEALASGRLEAVSR